MGMCCKKKIIISQRNVLEYKVEGSRFRDRPKRIWREVVQKDCQTHRLKGRMPWMDVDKGI